MITDLEKDLIQQLLGNELLLSVIRKVFNQRIDAEKPDIGQADNQLLGEKYRSYELSREILEKGFIDLQSYRINRNPINKFNKGK